MNQPEQFPTIESRMGIARNGEVMELEQEIGSAFYEKMLSFSPDAVMVTDTDFNIILANRNMADMYGYQDANELLGKNLLSLMYEDDDEAYMQQLGNLFDEPIVGEEREFVRIDGSTFTGQLNIGSFRNRGEAVAFAAMIKDMTKEKEKREKIRLSEEKHRRVFEQSPNAIIVADREGYIAEANESAVRISGFPLGELIGKHALELILIGEDDPDFMLEELLEGNSLVMVRKINTREGDTRTVEISSSLLSDGHLVANVQDVTERYELMELNAYKTYHDVLTGLHNRLSFTEELEKLENGRQYPVSIIMMDMDELKETNDMHGHGAGDQLIINAAEALKSSFQRTGDHISRLGGDEFAVLLPQVDENTAADLLERLRANLREAEVSASLGAATVHDWRQSLGEAQKTADHRMYDEKREKKEKANRSN